MTFLFDHLVGEREEIVGDFDAKRLGGFEVDYQLELGGLLNRKIGGLGAPEDLDVISTLASCPA
jgi:hypothetical protein